MYCAEGLLEGTEKLKVAKTDLNAVASCTCIHSQCYCSRPRANLDTNKDIGDEMKNRLRCWDGKIRMLGPFGSAAQDVVYVERSIMVAVGSGVVPYLSHVC